MPKNILLVSFDDALAPWICRSAFGEPLRLPALDSLCDVSTVFSAAYAQAPICGPSRASMMSTMMPHELGILNNAIFAFERITPAEIWSRQLKNSGWYCSSGGKVHHRYKPLSRPDHRELYSDGRKLFEDDMGLSNEMRRASKKYGGHRNGFGTPDGDFDKTYYDAQSADSAIEFLESYEGDAPFYRELGFFSPHVPNITPARFKEMYNAKNLKRPEDWQGYIDDNSYIRDHVPENVELRSEDYWQKTVRNYFSSYSHGDYHLGRVLEALRNSRHAANTVVVVISDHGFHLGNRNIFRKTTLWEQSLHIPFVVFDPERPQGQVIDDPVALIDLGPTVLDLAGVAAPARRHGRSLVPMIQGARDPERAVPSFYTGNVAIRKGRYRIIRYADGSFQLFDVLEDYWQLRDLGQQHPMFAPMSAALLETSIDCGFDFRTAVIGEEPGEAGAD